MVLLKILKKKKLKKDKNYNLEMPKLSRIPLIESLRNILEIYPTTAPNIIKIIWLLPKNPLYKAAPNEPNTALTKVNSKEPKTNPTTNPEINALNSFLIVPAKNPTLNIMAKRHCLIFYGLLF